MFNKFVKKIKRLSEQNQYMSSNRRPASPQQPTDHDSAEYEMINSLTNYKLILPHLKNQEEEEIKFLKLIEILAAEEIDLPLLKRLFYNYISYQYYTVRSLVWRVIVEYVPLRNSKWITKIQSNKVVYEKLLLDNLISTIKRRPKQIEHAKEKPECTTNTLIIKSSADHPLNKNSNSTWNTYFKDHELWAKIQKDMLRTRPKVKFFQEEHELELQTMEFEQPLNLSKNKRNSYHYDAVSRILFIFCKLNPEIGYSQGMNEIASLLYYVFTNKNSEYERRVSESDTYHVFSIIMSKLGPHHFTGKQQINQRIKLFSEGLKKVDQKLYKIFEENKIDLKLCCMRWMLIFMLQEFEINEAILVWDGLLCSEIGINKFIYYYCLAVMFIKRDELIENPTTVYGQLKVKPKELLDTSIHLYKEYPQLFK